MKLFSQIVVRCPIETSHSSDQLKKIKRADPKFRTAWLHDEVINSFMYDLEREFEKVIYCGSTEALVIAEGKAFRNLWKQKDLSGKDLLFIPFNPTEIHWVLIFIDIKTNTMYILDPLTQHTKANSDSSQKAINVARRLISKKFGINECRVGLMNHCLQHDNVSCGVLVCYYAHRIAEGISIILLYTGIKSIFLHVFTKKVLSINRLIVLEISFHFIPFSCYGIGIR